MVIIKQDHACLHVQLLQLSLIIHLLMILLCYVLQHVQKIILQIQQLVNVFLVALQVNYFLILI